MYIDHVKVSNYFKNWWRWPSSLNWPLNLQNISFELLNWPFCNFAFAHKLFIDHLKVLDKFVTGDLDLDLQGQICNESLNACTISCECDSFEPFWNFNSVSIIYITHVSDEFGTGAFDLDDQGQIGLQTSTV